MKDNKLNFDLETPYTLNQVAELLGKSPDWVKQNAIKTGALQFAPLGDSPIITGKWILEYVKSIGTFHGEPNCPKSKRGKSPRKKTNEADSIS